MPVSVIQPGFKLFGRVAETPVVLAAFVGIVDADENIAGQTLNGYGFFDFFDGQSVFDAVFRPCNKSFVVNPFAVRHKVFLIRRAAPALDERHILVGRKLCLVVGENAPVPFPDFPTVDVFGHVVVAVKGEWDNSACGFDKLFSVHNGVTHFSLL